MTARTRVVAHRGRDRSGSIGLPPGPWDDDWEPEDDLVEDDGDDPYGMADFEDAHRRRHEAKPDVEDEAELEGSTPLPDPFTFVPLKPPACTVVGCTPNTPCVFCE